jgi:glycosyltransferase involved in cell wall biosynthesis
VNVIQITPGAGGMYCGNCLRDNTLVSALRQLGHAALMVPLYLPLTLDETDLSAGTPVFFGGVNVYLDQQWPWFRRAPAWLRRLLDSPTLLRWAAGRAAKTRASEVGALTVSMLQGEHGNQTRELDELVAWLRSLAPPPEIVCLSNALLAGLTRTLKHQLRVPVVWMLQGEDAFLDSLPPPHRDLAWNTLRDHARHADLCIAPSRYYADRMRDRLGLPPAKVRVVYNGMNLAGFPTPASPLPEPAQPRLESPQPAPPVLGFFARMCREKGLDLLVDAYLQIRKRERIPGLRLRVGGSCGPSDQVLVNQLRDQLARAGCLGDVEFHPNLTRPQKIDFYRSLTVLSVPALYGEAFGLYLIEAMAAGVPVVQPRHGAFPELIEKTRGGVLCEPTADSLSETLEALLLDPVRRQELSRAAHAVVHRDFTAERMARDTLAAFPSLGSAA